MALGIVLAIEGRADIVVGSKHFMEQKILGELIAQTIENNTDLRVGRMLGLQGTKMCFGALVERDLDMYPEYTGTGLVNILGEEYRPGATRKEILEHVRKEFEEQWGLVWLAPLGFNNTYAFAMREKHARELGVSTISDLEEYKDSLRPGFDHEFKTRPEFERFEDVYGFGFGKDPKYLDPDLIYKALSEGNVDLIDAFSTDGRIEAYDLRVLDDDKNLFPPYDACILVRSDMLEEHAGLRGALSRLAGTISAEDMQSMNFEATEKLRSPANIAREFLASRGRPSSAAR